MGKMQTFSAITNERLIRPAEADCDKIDCYYRGPCMKDIYDRTALDKFLTNTSVGKHLEHDCFSFDKSVVLNRQVDKTKLKGLVDNDISGILSSVVAPCRFFVGTDLNNSVPTRHGTV